MCVCQSRESVTLNQSYRTKEEFVPMSENLLHYPARYRLSYICKGSRSIRSPVVGLDFAGQRQETVLRESVSRPHIVNYWWSCLGSALLWRQSGNEAVRDSISLLLHSAINVEKSKGKRSPFIALFISRTNGDFFLFYDVHSLLTHLLVKKVISW